MITREICQRVLHKAVSTGADYAEIYAQNTVYHNINMIASKVDAVKDTVVAGAAVRVYKGLRSVMASTVDTSESGLLACAEKAAEALGQGTAQIDIVLKERIFGDIHPVKICPVSASNKEKVAILKEGYFAAKEYDSCITQVSGSLADVDHNILIANTEGLYTKDRRSAPALWSPPWRTRAKAPRPAAALPADGWVWRCSTSLTPKTWVSTQPSRP